MSKTGVARIPRCQGRVEFIANKDFIRRRREEGEPNTKIHAELAEAGKMTMAYSTFCYHMAKMRKEDDSASPGPGGPQRDGRQPSPDGSSAGRQSGFSVNKTPSSGDMI